MYLECIICEINKHFYDIVGSFRILMYFCNRIQKVL